MSYGRQLYGTLVYGEYINEQIVKEYTPDLIEYLPDFFKRSLVMSSIQQALSDEMGLIYFHSEDILQQLFIETATWGLTLWERFLGIPTDLDKPVDQRREVIRSKIRGVGTITKQHLINVALAFSGGEVDVIEYPRDHHFTIKFIGVRGVPANMQDLTATINEVKPAHLTFDYEYTYTAWREFIKWQTTWNRASTSTWDEITTRNFSFKE